MTSSTLAELSGIALAILAVSAIFWVVIGRFKLHNALINIYISFAILQVVAKETAALGKFAPFFIFLGLVIFFTMIDSTVFEIHLSGSGLRIWQVLILSFLEAGLFISIVSSLLPEKQVSRFISEESLHYMTSPWASIFWMLAPLIFLILIGRRSK